MFEYLRRSAENVVNTSFVPYPVRYGIGVLSFWGAVYGLAYPSLSSGEQIQEPTPIVIDAATPTVTDITPKISSTVSTNTNVHPAVQEMIDMKNAGIPTPTSPVIDAWTINPSCDQVITSSGLVIIGPNIRTGIAGTGEQIAECRDEYAAVLAIATPAIQEEIADYTQGNPTEVVFRHPGASHFRSAAAQPQVRVTSTSYSPSNR